jgi:hypothetical protein
VVERVPLNLPFPAQAGATAYRVQLARHPGNGTYFYDQVSSAAAIRGQDLPDAEYVARVRSVDTHQLEGASAQYRFRLNARPEPPALLQPALAAAVVAESPTFEWGLADNLQGFHLQIARDNQFAQTVFDDRVPAAKTFTLPMVLAIGEYYWRVAAVAATEGEGPFSDAQPFRRVPPGPAVEAPEIAKDEMVLRWRAGTPGQRYQVQMARDEAFTEIPLDRVESSAESKFKRPAAGEYFVRIKTIDVDGYEGPWGTVQAIEVPSTRSAWWLLILPLIPFLL